MKSLVLTVSLVFFAAGCAPEVNEFSAPAESSELDRARGDSDEDDTCEDRCTDRARRLYRRCVSAGGSEERCAVRARAFRDHCEDRCDADRTWERCEEACGDRAKAFARRCVDAGGSAERCRHAARERYGECLDRCDALDCE